MLAAIMAFLNGSAGSGTPETPPDVQADPKGGTFIYSGNRVGIQWVNGDASLSTRIYYPDSSTLWQTSPPGATSRETGHFVEDQPHEYNLKHVDGGVESENFLTITYPET
jgi:hypothetical protein